MANPLAAINCSLKKELAIFVFASLLFLLFPTHSIASFSPSDLAGTWRYYSLSIGTGQVYYLYGTITIDSQGNISSGTWVSGDNNNGNVTFGAITITGEGRIACFVEYDNGVSFTIIDGQMTTTKAQWSGLQILSNGYSGSTTWIKTSSTSGGTSNDLSFLQWGTYERVDGYWGSTWAAQGIIQNNSEDTAFDVGIAADLFDSSAQWIGRASTHAGGTYEYDEAGREYSYCLIPGASVLFSILSNITYESVSQVVRSISWTDNNTQRHTISD